ncbi:MAG: UDP-N-acetylmuramate--L-alanine ligase [Thermincola sp.]|nr:UDP-N-acetylmuramate--L-alanine ligase [Thermincola sp.]MDT3701589.1 UDP-N-acetylmuramate--L-alanine ligase [Thermincola sp.]
MGKGQKKVHFIGIGGSGMSGIATIMIQQGYKVSGSDLNQNAAASRLINMGADVSWGHDRVNLGHDTEAVVISTAIRADNPELVAAREEGIEIVRRGEMLARLMAEKRGVAVAGAHGKTTTSSMIALVFEKNGLDPTVVVGGDVLELGGNAKLGLGKYLVAEADESDGSFLLLAPTIEVITNIEDDHLDYYGSREAIKEAFADFLQKLPDGGYAVVCADDPNIRDLISGSDKKIVTYGTDYQSKYMARNIRTEGLHTFADIYYENDLLGQLELNVPGLHNINNAMAAIAVGRIAGLSFLDVARVLKDFRGVHRRFELLGKSQGINVVDDYAHHPTEVKATLRAAKQTKANRVIGVFQPHRFTRTKFFFREFGESFSDADMIVINEIYGAGETPLAGVTAELIVNAIRDNENKPVYYFKTLGEVTEFLSEIAKSGDLILTMGAGNIRSAGIDLVERLKAR